jgi:hypothetical protein
MFRKKKCQIDRINSIHPICTAYKPKKTFKTERNVAQLNDKQQEEKHTATTN